MPRNHAGLFNLLSGFPLNNDAGMGVFGVVKVPGDREAHRRRMAALEPLPPIESERRLYSFIYSFN